MRSRWHRGSPHKDRLSVCTIRQAINQTNPHMLPDRCSSQAWDCMSCAQTHRGDCDTLSFLVLPARRVVSFPPRPFRCFRVVRGYVVGFRKISNPRVWYCNRLQWPKTNFQHMKLYDPVSAVAQSCAPRSHECLVLDGTEAHSDKGTSQKTKTTGRRNVASCRELVWNCVVFPLK